MAGDAKGNLFSFFGGKKRIPKDSYEAYFKVALIIDFVLCWMPLAGTVFILYCRGMWWLNGYKTDKMLATTLVNAALEALPGLSFSPSCSLFVWMSYRINKSGTEPLEGEEGGGSRIERAQDVAFRALRMKNARAKAGEEAEQTGGAGIPENQPEKGRGSEGKSRAENLRPQSLAKDSPNPAAPKETKPVDGIAPQTKNTEKDTGYQPRQPVFRQQPLNDNEPPESPEPEEETAPIQNDTEEEYFDNARRVA